MSEKPEAIATIQQWVESAEGDLATAENTIEVREVPAWSICFHAQQCVEKYLKAWLAARRIPIPRVHDLDELLGLLPVQEQPELAPALIEDLTRYATTGRYPGSQPPSREDAREALTAARQIRALVRARLPKETFEP